MYNLVFSMVFNKIKYKIKDTFLDWALYPTVKWSYAYFDILRIVLYIGNTVHPQA